MYETFLTCLLIWCSFVQGQNTFREDYNYYQDVNGWLKLQKIPANWHDARLRCKAEGASLASPSTLNLQNIMMTVMVTESTNPHLGIYSGIHSTFSVGTYTTIEGVPITNIAAYWAVGQPDHVYSEKCVVFHMNGTLENVNCSKEFQYICYKKFENLKMNKCNTFDDGYKWQGRTGHCYKFHSLGQTWARAHMICSAEGGYLAIINNEEEAIVLKELFAEYPHPKMFSRYKDSAVIGYREWPDERSWYTVHGQTLEEAGYAKWSDGQPDDAILDGEGQHCGAIWRTALLDDVWCDQHFAFICERDPQTSVLSSG